MLELLKFFDDNNNKKKFMLYIFIIFGTLLFRLLSFISYIHEGATVFEILDNFAAFVKNISKIVTNEYTT